MPSHIIQKKIEFKMVQQLQLEVGNESKDSFRKTGFFQFCMMLFEKLYLKIPKSKIYKIYTIENRFKEPQFLKRHICKILSTSQSNSIIKLLLHPVDKYNRYRYLVKFGKSQIFIGIDENSEIFMVESTLNLVLNAANRSKFGFFYTKL